MTMIRTFEVRNKLGIHARVAAKLVSVAVRFRSGIFFEKDGSEVNAKSLLGILTMACPQGSFLTVRADGDDAAEAMEQIARLFEEKFGEE
ncbi:MAG: HPr family phosphocarrier protein [Deltaproteobacteria bacterium HGW-Deltaproteobacteria-19]|jgi:phosphocarrier protein|nr:MAG: HPr family phosphocarrier protein [Deltaproteobacteria bacterium HGW-Deltaproteobacteria-19]